MRASQFLKKYLTEEFPNPNERENYRRSMKHLYAKVALEANKSIKDATSKLRKVARAAQEDITRHRKNTQTINKLQNERL